MTPAQRDVLVAISNTLTELIGKLPAEYRPSTSQLLELYRAVAQLQLQEHSNE